MAEARVRRRLAAILAADVVGYSRQMGADEAGTLARLKVVRAEVVDPAMATYDGRIVKTTGDGVLVEFASVVDAVECAVALQQTMAARNEGADGDAIVFRIGVNIGDVIVEDSDIYGDGVNVAARLEALAEPGGVCVSGKVYDEVRNKLDLDFDDLGAQTVKNIAEPVPAYRARLAADAAAASTPANVPARYGVAVDVSTPVPGFGGRPAIAVLPFDNMSNDPDQEYLADGIAEDILTRLAMWRWLPVIARNSSFTYKGRAVDVKEVGRALGARYVLEGSVRKAAARVRVTGQLIDAETGHHVWANRYDRELDDIFALQDEITEAIVAALEPAVGKAKQARAQRRDPANLDAWDQFQRAIWHFNRFTANDFAHAIELSHAAAVKDPGFALPLSAIAAIRVVEALFAWTDDPAATVREAHETAQAAIALDATDAFANAVLAYTNAFAGHHDAAIRAAEAAIDFNPSFAVGYHALGVSRMYNGEPALAGAAIENAIRFSPRDSFLPIWLATLSATHYMRCDFETALEVADRTAQIAPHNPMAHGGRTNALAQLGRLDEARAALATFLELSPNYNTRTARSSGAFREEADFQFYVDGLRKAGWDG